MRLLACAFVASTLAGACTGGPDLRSTQGLRSPSYPPPPSVSCTPPVIPGGTYAVTIPADEVPVDVRNFSSGRWTWTVGGMADFHCFFRTSLSHTAEGQVDDIEIPAYTVAAPNRV